MSFPEVKWTPLYVWDNPKAQQVHDMLTHQADVAAAEARRWYDEQAAELRRQHARINPDLKSTL